MTACSGGGDDGSKGTSGAVFKTSVAETKRVDMLTPAESAQLCKDFSTSASAWDKEIGPGACKFAGLFASFGGDSSQASCEAVVNECLKEVSKPEEGADACGPIEGCTATIDEITKCLNDQAKSASDFFNKLPTCEQIAKGVTVDEEALVPVQPASCKAIESKCPSIANMETEEDS